MSDDADRAQNENDEFEKRALAFARNKIKQIDPGEPGECDYCAETFSRLVGGACGHCRDKYKLP